MARKLPVLIILASAVLALGGCNAGPFGGSTHVWDASGRRLWTGDGRKASLSADYQWNFVKVGAWYQWSAPGGREWQADQVVRACESVSRSQFEAVPGTRGSPEYRFASTRTIVCLDPTVVVISPVGHTARSLGVDASGGDLAYFMKLLPGTIQLPTGYRYGTTVPRAEGLIWFSPDFAPEPRPLVSDARDMEIALPEGRLEFKPSGRVLRVGWSAS